MTGDLGRGPEAADTRRHDLDALRALAMLLGIALHAALSFMDFPWVVQDRVRAPEFGFVVSAIHGFRMPLFFMMSGFFTAMLWRRRIGPARRVCVSPTYEWFDSRSAFGIS